MVETQRRRPWTSAPVLVAAGAIVPFAFAPWSFWPLIIPAFALLFEAWSGAGPRLAAGRGFWFGLGMFGHGVWWIQVSIHQFGLPVHAFSIGMTVLFVMFMALYPAGVGAICGGLRLSRPWAFTLGAPALWVMGEALRGWALSGFPWLLVGYSQIEGPLTGYAPVAGGLGTSLAATLLAGLLQLGLRVPTSRMLAVLAALAIIAGGASLARLEWTQPDGARARVALVQGAVPQAIKWQSGYRTQSIALYETLSTPHWGTDLIIWPETALPAFAEDIPEILTRLVDTSTRAGSALFVGMPRGDRERGAYFNSVLLLDGSSQRYDKHHLVPFGEYLPLDAWLRPMLDFLSIPMSDFAPGATQQDALQSGRFRAGVSICYEDAYASEVRKSLPDANVLINVSDDAWFGDSIAPHQHLEIARMRALETGRWLLRATNTGISAIIDARGQLVARSPQFEAFVLSGEFEPRRGMTPYARLGDWPVLVLCAGVIVLAWLRRTPKPRMR